MTARFPHEYKGYLSWEDARSGFVSNDEELTLRAGPPPQFDGPGGIWSPEDLLLASVQSCLMTTFFALANRKELQIAEYTSEIQGTLDKTRDGIVFTELKMEVTFQTDLPEKAQQVLKMAKKYCIVSNTLHIKPIVDYQIRPIGQATGESISGRIETASK